jgi:hypothetical protein
MHDKMSGYDAPNFDWLELEWGTKDNKPDAVELTQLEYDDMLLPEVAMPTSPFRKDTRA